MIRGGVRMKTGCNLSHGDSDNDSGSDNIHHIDFRLIYSDAKSQITAQLKLYLSFSSQNKLRDEVAS